MALFAWLDTAQRQEFHSDAEPGLGRAGDARRPAVVSVDSKQLQTLMARGLDEEQATDLIIEGLLG